MRRAWAWLNDLWQRFWLYQFRNLCPQPTPWAKLLMAWQELKAELGALLAPAMENILKLIEYDKREET